MCPRKNLLPKTQALVLHQMARLAAAMSVCTFFLCLSASSAYHISPPRVCARRAVTMNEGAAPGDAGKESDGRPQAPVSPNVAEPPVSPDAVNSYLSGADTEEYAQAVREWQSAAAARNAAANVRIATEDRMVRKLAASAQLVTEASTAFMRAVERAEKEATEAQAEAQAEMDSAAAAWQEAEDRAVASLGASEALMAKALQATKDKEEAARVAWAGAREAAASEKERADALQRAQAGAEAEKVRQLTLP